MATFGDLKARIADDLARSDLNAQIGHEINDAIAHHSAERFWFNETVDTGFTAAGQSLYAIASDSAIADFVKVDRLSAVLGTHSWVLRRADPLRLPEDEEGGPQGQPSSWAYYMDQFRLYPTPDREYGLRIQGHARFAPLSADADANPWTNAAESLIRASAKKRIYARIIRNHDEAALAEADETRDLDRLRRETTRRQATGIIRPFW